jgi:hypothetical protein
LPASVPPRFSNSVRWRIIRALYLAAFFAATPSVAATAPPLTVDGTEFVLTLEDGRALRSADLVGATLMMRVGNDEVAVTIESVEEDPDSIGGDVFLHRFIVKNESGKVSDFCTSDAQGQNLGFPVPKEGGGFELTCTSGAIGKCVRWGYRFWKEVSGGPPLRALHQACIRMTRADYGGDGSTFTRDGTTIFFCDRFNVIPCGNGAAMAFEAAWGADGAVCVAHPRIAEIVTLGQLAKRYPHLASRLGPDVCGEESAMRDPDALLFNRSEE